MAHSLLRFLLTAACGSISTVSIAQWTFEDLHPAGATSSFANGTGFGYTVGVRDRMGGAGSLTAGRALVWSLGVTTDITPSFASAAQILATHGGNHVGQATINGITVAGYWSGANPTFVSLTPKNVAAATASAIYNTQQGGSVTPRRSFDARATVWSGSFRNSVDLHPNGWQGSEVRGIFNGVQVGGAYSPSTPGLHACRWLNTKNSFLDMHPAGFDASDALSIYGSVAVGLVYNFGPFGIQDRLAYRWDPGTGTGVSIHPIGWSQSIARGAAPGAIVGSVYDDNPTGNQHAFFWNTFTNGFLDLHSVFPFGVYESSAAFSVWANGTHLEVAGTAKHIATGQQHAILWKFDPEV